MKRTVSIMLIGAVLAIAIVGGVSALPAGSIDAGAVSAGVEQAQAQSVKKSGDRGADLLSEIIGPLLIVLIGAFALVALARREVGLALSAAAIGGVSGF